MPVYFKLTYDCEEVGKSILFEVTLDSKQVPVFIRLQESSAGANKLDCA